MLPGMSNPNFKSLDSAARTLRTQENLATLHAAVENLPLSIKSRVKTQIMVIPNRLLGAYLKAVLGRASATQCIKAKCQECVGWEDMSERIGKCTCYGCPLWHKRPFKS